METLVSPEEERARLLEEVFKRPIVIGVEGGPCSGKTTFVESLKNVQGDRPIIILPETATLIAQGYRDMGLEILDKSVTGNKGSASVTMRQFATECLTGSLRQIQDAKSAYYGTGAVIVADRVDCGDCYIDDGDYQNICRQFGVHHRSSYDLIDKILYFPTIAHKDVGAYERLKATNPIRRETAQQAIAACDSTFEAVKDCPELHYIDLGDFESSLEAATQYVLNPEKEHEKGGYLTSDTAQELRAKLHYSRRLGRSYIKQSYHTVAGVGYRVREETTDRFTFPPRQVVTVKDPKDFIEKQRLITWNEAVTLKREPECCLAKVRERYLYTDPETGATDVWCLDEIKVGNNNTVWAFEVERHSQEALQSVRPPVERYLDKFCSNHGLARLALMFC